MAAKKKAAATSADERSTSKSSTESDQLVEDLIRDLNKEHQTKIAWNLSVDESPTHVKRWISTGSTLLDYAVANRPNGGLPEGRVVEIFGPPSIGKSHLAAQFCRSAQRMGGIAVYIDTENAINPSNLQDLGVDVSKRFIYADPSCIEDVFTITESVIQKIKASAKDIPVVIVWDSVAATPPKAELEAGYDENSIGLAARVISKSMRKITMTLGNQNVLFVCLNQIRLKVGVIYGSPETTPGGLAIPFHASVRIKLAGGKRIEDPKTKELIGINVEAQVIKNKVARPFRSVEFAIRFGRGIEEHEQLFDVLRAYCDDHRIERDGRSYSLSGMQGWKTLLVSDLKTGEVLVDKKFVKSNFDEIRRDYREHVDVIVEAALTRTNEQSKADQYDNATVDENGYGEPEDAEKDEKAGE